VLAGGAALKTPFGTFHAPNISPDREAGIGGWSTLDFVNAMTRGISPGGRHYYPAFPYTSYQRMRLTEVVDLKAFLDTLSPATTRPPGHELPFPFNIRRGLGLWKLLHLDGKPFGPDPAADEIVNRGKYLVEGPGHCGECHTPRDGFGGLDRSRWLAGGPNPEGKGRVPNITPHADGLADWSEDDIAYALETGFTPEFDSLGSSMADVQLNMAHLPATDRQAIARYLKSVPPLASDTP
jgi:mono/diheme cytochrome c family protein